jgi:hypothetical protein
MRLNSKDIADLVDGLLFGENLELVGLPSLENPKERTLIFCPSERDVERVKDVKDTTLVVPKPVEHPSYILVKDTKLALLLFWKSSIRKSIPRASPKKPTWKVRRCWERMFMWDPLPTLEKM